MDTPHPVATPTLNMRSLTIGAAHELDLVVASGLKMLERQAHAYSLPQQLALLADENLLSALRRATRHHPYASVAARCDDSWLRAMVLILKSPVLRRASDGWLVAGAPPSPQLFQQAATLCHQVPHLRDLAATIATIGAQQGEQGETE